MSTNPVVVGDILDLLVVEDATASALHGRLLSGGHLMTLECVYEHLVHLEAMERVRLVPQHRARALWGAL